MQNQIEIQISAVHPTDCTSCSETNASLVAKSPSELGSMIDIQEASPNDSSDKELVCRICLENTSTSETGNFLSPCNCSGSIQFVHEYCLKCSIISRSSSYERAVICEICQSQYNISVKIIRNVSIANVFDENWLTFVKIILLIFIVGGFGVATYLCCNKMLDSGTTGDYLKFKAFLMLSLMLLLLTLSLAILLFTSIEGLFIRIESEWKIYNKDEPLKIHSDEDISNLKLILGIDNDKEEDDPFSD